ncbi:MAG: hypothetical protein LBR76_08925 [Oscillospiraceae bacterium]|jgi:hypothetical protein|nr:hypothetical protein [Oscillospiraceae bacterium]
MKERLKTVLILMLSLSALFLLSRTWVYDMEPGNAEQPAVFAPARQDYTAAAVIPARCAVMSGGIRRGAQYSQAARTVYASFRPILTEALNEAGEPRLLSTPLERRTLMDRDGVYFEYTGSYPMPLISAWLSAEGPAGGNVTAMGLSFFEGKTELYWREADGSVWAAPAGTEAAQWPGLPEGMSLCAFAYESEKLRGVTPWLLVIDDQALYPSARLEAPPDIRENLESYTPFLESLGMPPLSTNFYASGDARIYISDEGARSCEIASGGGIFYADKTPVPEGSQANAQPRALILPAAALRALDVVSSLKPATGEASYEVYAAEQTEEGVTVTLMLTLSGVPILHDPAVVVVEGSVVRSVSLKLCGVQRGSESGKPLPPEYAALLPGGERLGLCYSGGGDGLASVGWMAIG